MKPSQTDRSSRWAAVAVFALLCSQMPFPAGTAGLQQMPLADTLLRLLANPTVAYLLFVLGLLGLVGEVVTPGTAVPGVVGAVFLILGLIGLAEVARAKSFSLGRGQFAQVFGGLPLLFRAASV